MGAPKSKEPGHNVSVRCAKNGRRSESQSGACSQGSRKPARRGIDRRNGRILVTRDRSFSIGVPKGVRGPREEIKGRTESRASSKARKTTSGKRASQGRLGGEKRDKFDIKKVVYAFYESSRRRFTQTKGSFKYSSRR